METGRFGASVGEVAALLDFYDVPEETRAELLSQVARNDGVDGAWIVRAGGAQRRQSEVQATETRVKTMSQYSALSIPGLLQSPLYVRAVADIGGFGDVVELAARRLARQSVLSDTRRFRYALVLDEVALLRWPGDNDVMADQIDHLIKAIDSGHVALRLRLLTGNARAFPVGSFIVYDFISGPPVAMAEEQTTDLYLSADSDLTAYRSLFEDLQRESLDAGASRAYVEQLRSQLVS